MLNAVFFLVGISVNGTAAHVVPLLTDAGIPRADYFLAPPTWKAALSGAVAAYSLTFRAPLAIMPRIGGGDKQIGASFVVRCNENECSSDMTSACQRTVAQT